MMYSVWLYRFKPGVTYSTLDMLRTRGAENVYPGAAHEGGTFLGRCWGHTNYTFGSVFRRDGLTAARAEVADVDNLLRNLRILSPNVAAMEVRNIIPRDDVDLKTLGDDGWNAEAVTPWIEAAKANPEVAHHLNVIGMSCLQNNTFPPYNIQAVWRDKLGHPQQWLGGVDPRTYIAANAAKVG